jgi:DNA invertase Pin-like site-specific DNA recombinase
VRAALYARYSTGNQSPLSIEDQLRLVRPLAAQLGAHVVREFTDAEISGFSAARPGLNALLDFVRGGGCDLVIAEHSDRLARDGEKSWQVFNLFRAAGVRYVTVQEGEVTIVHQGVSSLVSELKGDEVRQRTRRGLQGVVEAGRSGGGLTYGYRKVRAYDAAGEPLRGLLEIDDGQAEVVRRIFRDYAAGTSPLAIAAALNREGVEGPRGGTWNASTIAGNVARGVGIIHNELYVGVRIWGRRTFVKDRATGARRGRAAAGPPIRQDVPELRIVEAELWNAVRTRYAQVSTGPMGEGVKGRRRPKRFLQGLITCGLCGRPMHRAGPRDALRCATRIEKGACANTKTPGYGGIEARVFAAIRGNLLRPDAIELAIREIQAGMAAAQRDAGKRQAKISAELAEVKRRMARLIDQVEQGAPWTAVAGRHAELDARRLDLEAQLAGPAARAGVAMLHPSAAREYRRLIEELTAFMDDPTGEAGPGAQATVRALIHEIRVTPGEGHGQYGVEILGDLAPILHLSDAGQQKTPGTCVPGVSPQSMGGLGAGTRVTRRHTPVLPFRQVA